MGRRIRRVPVNLNIDDLQPVPFDEIKVILRGADPIIMSGGRTLLAKILKGSRESKALELNLDRCPVYGFFKDFSIKAITTKIDWLILNGYLSIEYDYRQRKNRILYDLFKRSQSGDDIFRRYVNFQKIK